MKKRKKFEVGSQKYEVRKLQEEARGEKSKSLKMIEKEGSRYRRMTPQELEDRLIRFGVSCTHLCRELPTQEFFDAKHVAGQLIRSSTHPGFHYPEARAAESVRDLLHKQKVLLKELREARAQLVYIEHMHYFQTGTTSPHVKEADELISIFVVSTKKLSKRLNTD